MNKYLFLIFFQIYIYVCLLTAWHTADSNELIELHHGIKDLYMLMSLIINIYVLILVMN